MTNGWPETSIHTSSIPVWNTGTKSAEYTGRPGARPSAGIFNIDIQVFHRLVKPAHFKTYPENKRIPKTINRLKTPGSVRLIRGIGRYGVIPELT